MRIVRAVDRAAVLAAASLAAVPVAAHPPEECRTALAGFARHAEAFEETRTVAGPVLDRLFAAWDEVEAADSHALRHAIVYRHFVTEFPRLRAHLSKDAESSAKAVQSAGKAIFCLARDR
ncbi:MAG: hypothetical protein OXI64_03765 [Defluviicoccus sp.]|nr:hypothetical protein [Defluviicoccus sp.]